jgi:S1-C subfamily serine protease
LREDVHKAFEPSIKNLETAWEDQSNSSPAAAVDDLVETRTVEAGNPALLIPEPLDPYSEIEDNGPAAVDAEKEKVVAAVAATRRMSVLAATAASDKETWDHTLSRAIRGIVSIKATTTRPFDTESAGDYTATGFVISKEHGLILSNRHVVNPAPITCVAVFVNYEEIPIYPVYRDPIHDFGVFRYNPKDLKHIKVEEIICSPMLRMSERIFALWATMQARSSRFSVPHWPVWTGTHPRTELIATMTSTPFTCRPRLEHRVVHRAARF